MKLFCVSFLLDGSRGESYVHAGTASDAISAVLALFKMANILSVEEIEKI